ncbi:hypothetical protein CBR_g38326 [Chara braunii]|uniref:Uncharacterized protein n=1 Tax=Chara braunii TaxID=69332 RepID=A0A388LPW4_CHABU|nr:hypothetical protein CBR_g38326 [Chara braunii]|eukprot:GBG84354.1 hypothetical protein CBR_g38326 [Chara braunii]
MGCDEDHSIEATEKLAGHRKLTINWKNKVFSVLTGSRLKSREIALAKGIVHIKWKDTGDVTSIAPFGNDPLEEDIMSAELKEAVAATKSHTFVLDLCEPVDLKLWKPQAFETLNSYLKTWCRSHWTLVVFVPRHHNLSFLASMHHLSFVKLLEGKWVRRNQQKKSFPVGNNLYTEDDCMYILFKGDDLRVNMSLVYAGRLPKGTAAAVWLPQRVTKRVVSKIPFTPYDWSQTTPKRQGSVYGDMEHNPTQFVSVLDFVSKKGEGVVFLGKPHERSVWELLKSLYFVESEEELKFGSYTSLISTDDEAATGVELDANAKEEESDTESLDLQYDPRVFVDRSVNKPGTPRVADGQTGVGHHADEVVGEIESSGPLVALDSRSGGTLKSAGIRTTSFEVARAVQRLQSRSGLGEPSQDPTIGSGVVRDGNASPERERRPLGLLREATSAGSGDTETTKSTEIRTSSGGGGRPGIVVPPGGAACTETEEWSSGFNTGTGEGSELDGREGEEGMEEGKEGEKGEEEGEEGEEEEEGKETKLIELLEGREGAKGDVGIGDDDGEDSEDNAGSGESSDEFGQLYGEHHEDDVNDDNTTMEMETQVVSTLSAEPEDYEVQPLTSVVDLQHRFDKASVAMSPSKASRHISIEEVIDGILGDQHVPAHPSTTPDVDDARNVKSSVAVALAFSPPNSPVLRATLADGGEGEVRGRQHVTSPKKFRVDTQALDVLVLPTPTSPTKERRDKPTGKL